MAVPGVMLAQAIGRWGNFFNGEAHGGIVLRSTLENLHIPETIDGDFSKSPVPFCSNDMITNETGIAEG